MKGEGSKVLVVDDDKLLRDFYARVFENMGFQAVCAEDGEQAILFMEKARQPFSLVLMDLLMPVKTGWEAMEFIRGRAEWQNLPIVAITGLCISDEDLSRLNELCDAILLKNQFSMTSLQRCVEQLVGHRTEMQLKTA
jgi:CheY-like chemotaxis protein